MRKTGTTTATMVLALGLIGTTALGQATWTQLTPTSAPSKRCQHSIVEMGSNGVIMFGGEAKDAGDVVYNETWSWDGTNWTLLNPTLKPSARGAHSMCYDWVRKKIIMYGGWNKFSYQSDTWEFDGTTWRSMGGFGGPVGRDWTAMSYDPNSGTTILFGGHDWHNFVVTMTGGFDDMWAWNGATWTQLSPAVKPPGRAGHAMVYDPNLNKVLLFGGYDIGVTYNDMWAWDGTNWAQLTPPVLPTPRSYPSMTWDDARQRVVLHAGTDAAGGVLNDVWEWDGVTWTQTSTSGPALTHTFAVYDSQSQAVLVQGGALINDRTQTDGTTWSYTGPVGGWINLGNALPGSLGSPTLFGQGALSAGSTVNLNLGNAWPNSTSFVIVGLTNASLPFYGGILVPYPNVFFAIPTGPVGAWTLGAGYPSGIPSGIPLYFQIWIIDATGPQGYTASNALTAPTQ